MPAAQSIIGHRRTPCRTSRIPRGDQESLPTLPRVWAGEATAYDPQYPPLAVHGVYISGVEVTNDVDKYLGLKTDKAKFEKY